MQIITSYRWDWACGNCGSFCLAIVVPAGTGVVQAMDLMIDSHMKSSPICHARNGAKRLEITHVVATMPDVRR